MITAGMDIIRALQFNVLMRNARADYEPEVSGMMVDDTVRMTYHLKCRDPAIADYKVSLLFLSGTLVRSVQNQ